MHRLRAIFNNVSDALIIFDASERIIDVNESMLKLFNLRREQAIGFTFSTDLSAAHNPMDRVPGYWRQAQAGEQVVFEWKARRPGDGSQFEAEIVLSAISLEDQDGVMACIRDVSRQREAERRLAESEAALRQSARSYRKLIDQAPFPVLILRSTDLNVEYANHRAAGLFGEPLAKAAGLPSAQLFANPGDRDVLIQQLTFRGQVQDYETELCTLDGRRFWALVSASQVDHLGAPAYFVAFNDITERARLEAAEREQRRLVETIYEAGQALSSSLVYEHVLDVMLEQISRLLPYDSACIMQVDDGWARPARSRGYETFGKDIAERVATAAFEIAVTRNLQTMLRSRQPLVIPDVDAYPGWNRELTGNPVRSWLGTPIVARGQVIAFFSLDHRQPNFYTPRHAEMLGLFAAEAALALENARLFAETQRLAVTDPLTGLYNRRYFIEQAAREVERAQRYHHPVSVLMVDLDHFKQINDSLGHAGGDLVLQGIARALQSYLRRMDLVGRFGGEEFVCLLPETEIAGAALVAERLRQRIQSQRIETGRGLAAVTACIGVSQVEPEARFSIGEYIDRADRAMYAAKLAGRNCIRLWDEGMSG
jgi:diguanylate cyclase (GGDEF)-like protein/PAS domain S-box-containing protein